MHREAEVGATAGTAGTPPSRLRRLARLLGPGLIAGAADDDPTAIGTYAQAGAMTGYGLLWTTLLTLPMMIVAQFTAAKVAIVERAGLSATLMKYYPRPLVYAAVLGLLAANLVNAGADLGAIAAAVNLIVPLPISLLVAPITLAILLFLILGSYHLIVNSFKWLTLALLAYVIASVLAGPAWGAVLRGTFVPHVETNAAFLGLLIATLGGNLSPYLFFWEADLEVEELQAQPSVRPRRAVGRAARDTVIGMLVSNSIIYFIEIATAATLFAAGNHHVGSAAEAARALRPLLGNAAELLWAVGMIGSGLLAVPALTGSIADAVAALFGWRRGLDQPPRRAARFYLLLGGAMLLGMLFNFLGINPIRALVLSAVLNGFLSPPLLLLLVRLAGNREVMGDQVNGRWLTLGGWATIVIMTLAALGLLVTLL
ncbi:MAG TPA: divalent metal cation transporter [Thermomicrobiaceae bacterium]|nr:divalent metal cation transporter [Thermomicrobiaceae bacterium]